jgi:hypothetical protein
LVTWNLRDIRERYQRKISDKARFELRWALKSKIVQFPKHKVAIELVEPYLWSVFIWKVIDDDHSHSYLRHNNLIQVCIFYWFNSWNKKETLYLEIFKLFPALNIDIRLLLIQVFFSMWLLFWWFTSQMDSQQTWFHLEKSIKKSISISNWIQTKLNNENWKKSKRKRKMTSDWSLWKLIMRFEQQIYFSSAGVKDLKT